MNYKEFAELQEQINYHATQSGKNCAAINAIVKIFIDQVLAVKNAERSNNCEEKTPWITDE